MEKQTIKQPISFYEKLNRSLVSIVLIFLILYFGRHILIPMAFATVFAILLVRPVKFLENKGISRGGSSLMIVILFIIFIFFIFYFISSQVMKFRDDLPKLGELLLDGFHSLEGWLVTKFHISTTSIDDFFGKLSSRTLTNTDLFGNTMGTLSNTLIYIILVPIYTFLLLYYRRLIYQFFMRAFHERHSAKVLDVLGKIRSVIKSYIIGLFIEMIIVGIINCLGFFILGVKYALMLGVIAAILNIIPYIGIFMAAIISLLITSTTNSPGVVAGVAIVLLSVHLMDINIILPKVVGSKVKINILATLVVIFTGSAVWGIPGMFLSIPFIAILKIVFDSVEELQPWGILIGQEVKPVKRFKGLKV